MIRYYNVFYDGQLLAQRVRAMSESDACEQVYMRTGSASAYTGRARRLYTAEVA
jgi:ribosomal protein L20A (L18A)